MAASTNRLALSQTSSFCGRATKSHPPSSRMKFAVVTIAGFSTTELNPKPFSQRTLDLSFSGTYTPGKVSRVQMYLAASQLCRSRRLSCEVAQMGAADWFTWVDFSVRQTLGHFSDLRDSLVDSYIKDVLNETKIVLSPSGNTLECYRIYESLAAGAIPFVEDSRQNWYSEGWTHPKYGANFRCVDPLIHLKQLGAPIVFVDSWKRLPQILDSYSVKKLEEMQKAAIQWYKEFKLHYRYHIMELVYERFVGSL